MVKANAPVETDVLRGEAACLLEGAHMTEVMVCLEGNEALSGQNIECLEEEEELVKLLRHVEPLVIGKVSQVALNGVLTEPPSDLAAQAKARKKQGSKRLPAVLKCCMKSVQKAEAEAGRKRTLKNCEQRRSTG